MSFSEQLKLAVKKRAHFICCLCHALYVEIHHIIPESEGGPDTEDNAAPLCPSCHETYGANPEKRKFIREARDFWYELCETRFFSAEDQIRTAVSDALKDVATKADLDRLSVQNSVYVLGQPERDVPPASEQSRYSFVQEEYIHPRIVQELNGWISDRDQTVAAVDLVAANKSNRFYGAFWVRKVDKRLWVGWNDREREFSYSHVATSRSGVHMVECSDRGGGTGIFKSILLFAFDCDRSLDEGSSGVLFTRERILLKTLGSIGLGDRYAGTIEYRDGLLSIGPDEGWFKRREIASKRIPIR
jgi:hypothetical protein